MLFASKLLTVLEIFAMLRIDKKINFKSDEMRKKLLLFLLYEASQRKVNF